MTNCRIALIHLLSATIVLFVNCETPTNAEFEGVEPKYVLPYPVGTSFVCSQGFNSSPSHTGSFKYSVDFAMSIGTIVTAARDGRVDYVLESHVDDDQTPGHENVVVLWHEDSTYSRYAHLTQQGALVSVGQSVLREDTIGRSGNSGSSGGPHLHFDVTRTNTERNDQTIPFSFINAGNKSANLVRNTSYRALPY